MQSPPPPTLQLKGKLREANPDTGRAGWMQGPATSLRRNRRQCPSVRGRRSLVRKEMYWLEFKSNDVSGRFHQWADNLFLKIWIRQEVEGKIGFELCSDKEDKLTALHPWWPSGGQT